MSPRYLTGLTAALAAAVIGLSAALAASEPVRPPATTPSPERLVTLAAEATLGGRPLSGWARLDLGIPELPSQELLSDRRARVWRSGAFLRLSEAQPFGERSLVSGPSGVWTWDSATFSSRRLPNLPTLPLPLLGALSVPEALAEQALAALSPSTSVSTARPRVVASGRGVHVLVLRPRRQRTLIGRVEVSLDAEHHLPLEVALYALGEQSPQITAGFESVSFDEIPASIFDFRPPAGSRRGGADQERTGFLGGWKLLGEGWSSAAALRLKGNDSPFPPELLPFEGDLVTADIIEAGGSRWLVAGPVPLERLLELGRGLQASP